VLKGKTADYNGGYIEELRGSVCTFEISLRMKEQKPSKGETRQVGTHKLQGCRETGGRHPCTRENVSARRREPQSNLNNI
jgi:hypothetical protein